MKRKDQLRGASGFVTGRGSPPRERSPHRQETQKVKPEELRTVPRRGVRGEGALLSTPSLASSEEGPDRGRGKDIWDQEARPGMACGAWSLDWRGKANFLCKECSQRFVYDVIIILLPLESLSRQLLLGSVLISPSINSRILSRCWGLVCLSVWALPCLSGENVCSGGGREEICPVVKERGLNAPLSASFSCTRFPKQRHAG